MCLILFAVQHHRDWPLVIAANRDEFHHRPTQSAAFWQDAPHILGGKDLQEGGTWMGIHKKNHRIAALTNYRNPSLKKDSPPSRGHLVADYLKSYTPDADFLQTLQKKGAFYNGFNLICGTPDTLYYYGNQTKAPYRIEPGVHGLSNHLLNTPWPKVTRGRALLERAMATDPEDNTLLTILQDRELPADTALPDTGMGLEWERILAPLFITSPIYGTRSSTVLKVHRNGNVCFTEVSWDKEGRETGRVTFSWEGHD